MHPAHINHIRDVCGVDCVGIGGDYNGVPLLPDAVKDVSTYPVLFAALMEDGWSDGDLAKLAQGNVLRAMREMERARDDLASEEPWQDVLDPEEWAEDETGCMSDLPAADDDNEL